jgi:hypothetical protein
MNKQSDKPWPEFVKEKNETAPPRAKARGKAELTGWEAVIFQLEDDQEGSSVLSTAALAP